MALGLETFAARLPELRTPARHAFLLLEVSGRRERAATPYRNVPDDAESIAPGSAHPLGPRAPLCLALAIDASSSMRGPRFALAIQAARDLIDSLTPADRVAVVTFERSARIVLGPLAIDADGRIEANRVLDRLATGVGTNLSAGWREAADAMSRLIVPGTARRIMVLTDGLPSQGDKEPEVLRKMVAEGRARGLETSVIGIGDGIDETLCAALSRAGDGRFYYLRNEGLLGDVIANEIEGARRLAATEVSLVIALSQRIQRAEVLHRFSCQADGRTLEVRVGAVAYEMPRSVLVQVDVDDPDNDAILGAAVARGRTVLERRHEPTMDGYALGTRASDDPVKNAETSSDRISLVLPAGKGHDDARRRIASEVLTMRTLAEIRSAWDGFDGRDHEAVARRLGRARELRKTLSEAGLVDAAQMVQLPDVDAIETAMLGNGPEVREVRRTFASWAHNTQNSQIFASAPKPGKIPPKE